jgi:CheY-like chemotaxis protein
MMAKVLVVDDSLSVRKVVERALAPHGVQVLSVGSGTEAKVIIERDRPDLVICDVILPDADGFAVCGFVRTQAHLAKTPVLLMSGIINAKVREQAARVRANELMAKPFAADDLVRKTAALLPAKANAVSRTIAPAPDGRLNAFLAQLAALPGVKQVVLLDREGFVIGSVNATGADGETIGALVSCLKGPFQGMGEDLGHGALQGIIVEYERGMALLQNLGPTAALAAVLSDPTALGKVRYYVKRSLPVLFPRA